MGSPALRTAQAPPPLPPSGRCLCQEEGARARRGGDGITPMPGGGRKDTTKPYGRSSCKGRELRGEGAVWEEAGGPDPRTRSSPILAKRPHQRPCTPAPQKGGEVAGVQCGGLAGARPQKQLDGWHAADAPSHPNEAQMLSSSTRRKETWSQAHLCLQSGLAQPSAPASQPGSGWVGGGREAAPRSGRGFWKAAGGGTPVGQVTPRPERGSFRLSDRLLGLHNGPSPKVLDTDSPPSPGRCQQIL